MTTHELLVAGRNRIDRGWCKNRLRKRRPWGARYCMAGAIIYGEGDSFEQRCALDQLRHVVRGYSVGGYNDTHTKADVLAVYDIAIAATAPEPFVRLDNAVEVAA